MNAEDVMTRTVVTVHQGAAVIDAVRLMLEQRISGLPVIGAEGGLVGILTEGDLLRRAEIGTERQRPRWLEFLRGPSQHADDYVRSHARRVEDLMTRDVVTAEESTPLEEVVALMEKHRVRRIPVVNGRRLAGVVSRTDLLRALAGALTHLPTAAPGDAALRTAVLAALAAQDWGGRGQVSVIVTESVVFLEGIVYDMRERDAMRVAAENVAGVTEVCDHLDYLDPVGGVMYGA